MDAIHEAERLETAHRATGIPVASSQYAHLNVNERNPSPPPIHQSRFAPPENNVAIEKHHRSNPVPSLSNDPSSQRILGRFVNQVQFKPDANTLHVYEKNAPTPTEHEPNLSLQPTKSNIKPTGYRSPRPNSPSTSVRYNTIGLPRTPPPNNSNWILKDPPITPPIYRRRTDGLIEPRTPQGYMRNSDPSNRPSDRNRSEQPSLSSHQSRPERSFSHRTDQPSHDNNSYSRPEQQNRQSSQLSFNRQRDSSANSQNNDFSLRTLANVTRLVQRSTQPTHESRSQYRSSDARHRTPSYDRRYDNTRTHYPN